MANYLDNDIKFVAGVGEARAKLLEKELGIRTLGDMLCHYPFRYIDRTRIYRIDQIAEGDSALIQFRGRMTGVAYAGTGRKRRFTAYVSDPTGSAELVWFQGIKWIEKRIEVGREYLIFGRPSFFKGELSVVHPEIETIEKAFSRKAESGLQGIYSSTERLSSVLGTKGIYTIVCNLWPMVRDHIRETLPDRMRTRYGLLSLRDALYNIHFPQSPELLRQAQYRLKFEELLGIQLGIQSRRTARLSKNNGFLFPKVGGVFNTFFNTRLPFPLTGAQKRVLEEIAADLRCDRAMSRLVQGDVGCGKTALAFGAIAMTCACGYQAAMMAPTEILACQHYESAKAMLEPLGIHCGLLIGSMRPKAKREAQEACANGEYQAVFGTHALISEKVAYQKLGLVVTDEQHRFGVMQRSTLQQKGADGTKAPHVLVMSATPIPRTLALILYGDLDVSIVDELPPGRTPVKTRVVPEEKRAGMYGFLRQEVLKGHQAYVVCPLVEDSEMMEDVRSAQATFDALKNGELSGLRVGLTWGAQPADEKAQVLSEFSAGNLDVLVSTTVIEVGVNVPNASVMVIENAERFGLSQLHQLRGRVGRGSAESWCFLLAAENERLRILTQTNDGFIVAQKDLELRGPGDLMGTRQSGEMMADFLLDGDVKLLDEAAKCMKRLRENPKLAAERQQVEAEALRNYRDKLADIAMN